MAPGDPAAEVGRMALDDPGNKPERVWQGNDSSNLVSTLTLLSVLHLLLRAPIDVVYHTGGTRPANTQSLRIPDSMT